MQVFLFLIQSVSIEQVLHPATCVNGDQNKARQWNILMCLKHQRNTKPVLAGKKWMNTKLIFDILRWRTSFCFIPCRKTFIPRIFKKFDANVICKNLCLVVWTTLYFLIVFVNTCFCVQCRLRFQVGGSSDTTVARGPYPTHHCGTSTGTSFSHWQSSRGCRW